MAGAVLPPPLGPMQVAPKNSTKGLKDLMPPPLPAEVGSLNLPRSGDSS